MRFAICNETYAGWAFERVCEDVAAAGYGGVEVAPATLDDDPSRIDEARAAEIGGVARAAGLEVAGLHWLLQKPAGLHLTTPDADVRRRTVAHLCHLARVCAAMGGKVMVLGSPKQRDLLPGEGYDDAFARAAEACRAVAEACRAVAEAAGPLGVTLALEPLARAHTTFLTTAAEAVRLIEAVRHPACRLHLDVSAMCSEAQAPAAIIRAHARHLAHFHANDRNLGGPGTGDVDFVPILGALRETGYRGWVSVEVFADPRDPREIARRSLEVLSQARLFHPP